MVGKVHRPERLVPTPVAPGTSRAGGYGYLVAIRQVVGQAQDRAAQQDDEGDGCITRH